jgi:hypothetical protein
MEVRKTLKKQDYTLNDTEGLAFFVGAQVANDAAKPMKAAGPCAPSAAESAAPSNLLQIGLNDSLGRVFRAEASTPYRRGSCEPAIVQLQVLAPVEKARSVGYAPYAVTALESINVSAPDQDVSAAGNRE